MLPFVTLAACIQHIPWPQALCQKFLPSLKPQKLSIVSPLGVRVVKPTWLQRRCLACGHLAPWFHCFLAECSPWQEKVSWLFSGLQPPTRFVYWIHD